MIISLGQIPKSGIAGPGQSLKAVGIRGKQRQLRKTLRCPALTPPRVNSPRQPCGRGQRPEYWRLWKRRASDAKIDKLSRRWQVQLSTLASWGFWPEGHWGWPAPGFVSRVTPGRDLRTTPPSLCGVLSPAPHYTVQSNSFRTAYLCSLLDSFFGVLFFIFLLSGTF